MGDAKNLPVSLAQTDLEPAGADEAGALIQQAIVSQSSVETLERLMAMRRELKAEKGREAYFVALADFQAECPTIVKAKAVLNKPEKGGGVRYRFAPLDVIVGATKELLRKHGFSYVIKTKQDKDTVTAILVAHHAAGHEEETSLTVPIDHEAYMTEPQKVAAALTYAKRYVYCDAWGILTGEEDNDALTAGGNGTAPAEPSNVVEEDVGPAPRTYSGKRSAAKKAEAEGRTDDAAKLRDEAKAELFQAFGPAKDYRIAKRDDGTWTTIKITEVAKGAGVPDDQIAF